jgi:hypothetical protein
MDKYILIKESESTRTLENLADSNEVMLVLRVPPANVSQAITELSNIDNESWISSNNKTIKAGDISDSIILPKEAINA